MEVIKITTGKKIKKIRTTKNLTQNELSKLAGISEISIRKYENGERTPKYETILKIAKALDVTINDLMDFGELKKEVSGVEETENLLNILGYELKTVNTAGISGISQEESEHQAIELSEHIKNYKIPIYKIYCDGNLIAELTNSQYNNLKETIKYILDYEFYKLNNQ
ncbi:helix-turn-helix domain-containing protein [Clostridium massiliodielmoense]|uniref:helix-turn-helix domain-containing protein n=1 Tax=Clostridium massiliodielmoense TaxID=1776385 RepID=UPI00065DC557|nr:helix-turn-helix domain-containing protein [Clostridium massiliodielmoense]